MLELNTVPCHFGAKDFGRVNSLFRGGSQKERQSGWKGEQLVGSCIPVSGSSGPSGPRGQYANWARPPDALMGTAFSFQSELLESYAPSLHSGRAHLLLLLLLLLLLIVMLAMFAPVTCTPG